MQAILFDQDEADELPELSDRPRRMGDSKLLWVDLIARGGHQTNGTMKVLTLVSVILLPGALIAGVMGMNFKIPLFEHPWVFWLVVALIVAVAPVTLFVGKKQRWI